MKIADVLAKHEITMTSKRVEPTTARAAEYKDGSHYKCTFHWKPSRLDGRPNAGETVRLSVPFSQGSAWREPPIAADVMHCLLSDYVSDISFEDWAEDFGFDVDSRKALATFRLCQKQSRKLDAFLGADVFAELQNCERE